METNFIFGFLGKKSFISDAQCQKNLKLTTNTSVKKTRNQFCKSRHNTVRALGQGHGTF